jgi:hypothetical protein
LTHDKILGPHSGRALTTFAGSRPFFALMLFLATFLAGVLERAEVECAYPAITEIYYSPGYADFRFAQSRQPNGVDEEIEDLLLAPVDDSRSPTAVLRSRPFVLPLYPSPLFTIGPENSEPWNDREAREALASFLELRHAAPDATKMALELFDRGSVKQVVPAPTLRAALLMLLDWKPYDAVIQSILFGANATSRPFTSVSFASLGAEGAVATLKMEVGRNGIAMLVSDEYVGESPQQLVPVIVHESLHGEFSNSYEEELAANILDTIAYADVLLVDPESARAGTELSVFNNIQLYALLNSSGRGGGGNVGIATSPAGDVYVGHGLDRLDADSIRSGISMDPFYNQLPRGGSTAQETTAAIVGRFPGSDRLSEPLRYSESMLAVIDEGLPSILTPRRARTLAQTLELNLTSSVREFEASSLSANELSLVDRPFLPEDPSLFDLNRIGRLRRPLTEDDAREALAAALRRNNVPASSISDALVLVQAPEIVDLVSDPQLRAALLIIDQLEPWNLLSSTVLDRNNSNPMRVQIAFGDLEAAAPAVWDQSDGQPVIRVNSMLEGERPEILAAAVAEGALLEGTSPSEDQAVAAAAISTALYINLVERDPDIVTDRTWGTVSRNRDALALLNSGQWSASSPSRNADSIGFLLAAGSAMDILPGVYIDASSFSAYILASPRTERAESNPPSNAPQSIVALLKFAGVAQDKASAMLVDEDLLNELDRHMDAFLPAPVATFVAQILDLRTTTS